MNIKLDKRLIICFFLCCIISQGSSCGHISEIIFEEPDDPNNPSDSVYHARHDSVVLDLKRLLTLQSHTYSNSIQSITVHNGIAFVFYANGYCKIIDLNKKKVLKEATLASHASYNHVNNAVLSSYYYDNNDKYPLFYFSPYWIDYQNCYVERYHEDENRFELIQTITVRTSVYNNLYNEYVVDGDRNLLYALVYTGSKLNGFFIKIFKLPPTNKKEVTLTDDDLIAVKSINLVNTETLQGATYYNGHIYILFGEQYTTKQLYNVSTADFSYNQFEFTYLFPNIEPEGLAIYGDECYMCTNFPRAVWTFFRIEHIDK